MELHTYVHVVFGAPHTWYKEKQIRKNKQTNKTKQSKTELNRTKQKPNKETHHGKIF